jgi:hypothetical protein
MIGPNGSEDWHVLCELASKEMDSDKLLELAAKINSALDEHNQKSRYGNVETIIPPRQSSEDSGELSRVRVRPRNPPREEDTLWMRPIQNRSMSVNVVRMENRAGSIIP